MRTAHESRTIVVSPTIDGPEAQRLRDAGVELMRASDLATALQSLRALDIRSVLVEGGAEVAGALLGAGCVDRMVIFQAPVVLGAGARNAFAFAPAHALPDAPRWRVIDRRTMGPDVMTVYAPRGE